MTKINLRSIAARIIPGVKNPQAQVKKTNISATANTSQRTSKPLLTPHSVKPGFSECSHPSSIVDENDRT